MIKHCTFLSSLIGALGLAASALAADPINIGLVSEITGPNAEAGASMVDAARLAVDQINQRGGVLGRPFALKIEDSQSSNPGAVLAVTKLGNQGRLAALIAPLRSTQIQACAPTVAKLGLPTMIGGTDYGLTHSGQAWLFRARPHDGFSAQVMADYVVNDLKGKKVAVVYSTDAFGTGGKNMLLQSLKEFGATPVLVQGYSNNTQDFTPVVLAIKQSGADVLASYMPFDTDVAIFATQLRQLGLTLPWISSATIASDSARRLGKEALHDTYAVVDYFPGASAESRAFAEAFRAKYGREADFYGAWTFDAINILAEAIGQANGTEPESVRSAIRAIRGMKGAEGSFSFDKNGDGLHGYNVVHNEKGSLSFSKYVNYEPTN
jgi:branched-chain amino acid transport system substrate-binding protein